MRLIILSICLVFSNFAASEDLHVGSWECTFKTTDEYGNVVGARWEQKISADGSVVDSGLMTWKIFDEYLAETEIKIGYASRGRVRLIGSKMLTTVSYVDVQSIKIDGADVTQLIGRDADIDSIAGMLKDIEGMTVAGTILSLTQSEFITQDDDGNVYMCER